MATITIRSLQMDTYRLKIEIAYNKTDNKKLLELDTLCEALLDVINDELATGWFHYTSEPYKALQELKSELVLLNKRIYANRIVNKYDIEYLKNCSTDLYESL